MAKIIENILNRFKRAYKEAKKVSKQQKTKKEEKDKLAKEKKIVEGGTDSKENTGEQKMKVLFLIRDIQMFEREGIAVLSAVLKQAGHQTDLIQTDFEDIDKKMLGYKPNILAYSVTTGEHKHMIELNKKLKKKYDFISIFGGCHPTFFPDMIKEEGVDAVCIGEGEYAIRELADAIEKKNPFEKIQNLWVKKDGEIIKNPCRPLIQNLDELPLPDSDIVYKKDKTLREHGEKRIMISRGCPFLCTYCYNHKFFELYGTNWGRVRRPSVDYVIKRVLDLKKKYKVEFIRICDDNFIACSKEWFEEFSRRWKKEVGIPFLCDVRPNLVTPFFADKLKEAGCYAAFMAIEAADSEVRNKLLKRYMEEKAIADAYKLLKEKKIKLGYYNLLGLPIKDALKKDLMTLKMNIKYKPTMAWSSLFTPYPQTELANYAIKEGYFHGDYDKIPANNKIHSCLTFSSEYEKRQIENLHKFFGITVQYPFILPLVRILIKLPQNSLYSLVMYGYYGLILKFKMSTAKIKLKEIPSLIKKVFKIMKEE